MFHISDLVLFLGLCLSITCLAKSLDPITEGTEFIFVFMVHRHGDRTPESATISVIGNSLNMSLANELISQYGYGQLTDAGKRSGYQCGEFIRRRYDEVISSKYNKTELYIRTTDSTRVKMTSLAVMSAVFPAGTDNWSDNINWAPVPYTTVSAKYDFNLASINCPNFMAPYKAALNLNSERMKPYADVIAKVSSITGCNITSHPVVVLAVYDVFVSLNSLGYKLSDEIIEIMGDLSKANDEAWDITSGNDSLLHLQAGPLLNEFFLYALKAMSGTETEKVRIYAAHDLNVYSFEAITRVNRQGAPKYASLYSLELRRVTATGQYVVLPVYLDNPNEGLEEYLQVEGCSGEYLCDFNEFLKITSKYTRDDKTWRTDCGFYDSMIVDTSTID